MKNLKILFSIFFVASLFLACNPNRRNDNAGGGKDENEKAEDQNEAKFNKQNAQDDANALVDAYSSSMMEVALSDSLKNRLKSYEAKTVASAMIDAHTRINNEIKNLAQKKAITLPTTLTDDMNRKISDFVNSNTTGLDKRYLDRLVDDHKDAIKRYEKNASDCTDPDIKSWFSNTLPEMRKHLDMVMANRDKIK